MLEPMVTVCIIGYNQERTIRQTLESVIMQKTTFPFEILVHDDASTDGTAEIIKEYEEKYPEIIKPIYQTENQYSIDTKICLRFQYPVARGKYLAYCEGDDYWTDPYKLQKQFDVMEKNPDCSFCTHKVGVDSKMKKVPVKFPPIPMTEGIISSEKYIEEELGHGKWMFQTSCYFVRTKYMKEWLKTLPKFVEVSKAGDIAQVLYLLTKGNVYYIPEEMSHYRWESLGSVGGAMSKSVNYRIEQMGSYIAMLESYDEYTNFCYHEYISVYIKKREFYLLLDMGKFKEVRSKQYKAYYRELGYKRKIQVNVCAVLPFCNKIFIHVAEINNMLKQIRGKKNE